MKNENISCPQCGGNHTNRRYVTLALFLWSLIVVWIPFIGWILTAALLIGGFISIFKKGKVFFCKDCKNSFRVTEGKYLENKEPKSTVNVPQKNRATVDVELKPHEKTEKPEQLTSVPMSKPESAPTVKKEPNNLKFNIAGVTFENDKGKEIQTILRRIAREIAKNNEIESYGGYTNKEIIEYGAEMSEFEDVEFGNYISFEKDPDNEFDKNAIKVIVVLGDKKHHIGHVPKKENVKIGKLIDSDSIFDISANFVGGKIKEVEYDYEKDKEVVVVNELTLGVEITLYIKEEALLGI